MTTKDLLYSNTGYCYLYFTVLKSEIFAATIFTIYFENYVLIFYSFRAAFNVMYSFDQFIFFNVGYLLKTKEPRY